MSTIRKLNGLVSSVAILFITAIPIALVYPVYARFSMVSLEPRMIGEYRCVLSCNLLELHELKLVFDQLDVLIVSVRFETPFLLGLRFWIFETLSLPLNDLHIFEIVGWNCLVETRREQVGHRVVWAKTLVKDLEVCYLKLTYARKLIF